MDLDTELKWEDKMSLSGQQYRRYKENSRKLTKAQSLSSWGEGLCSFGYEKIIEHVEDIKKKVESGVAGIAHSQLKPLLQLPSEVVAGTTMRTIVDQLTIAPSLHQLAMELADRLWIEAMLNRLTKTQIKKYQRSRQRKRHKIESLKHMQNTEEWTAKERMTCGATLIYIAEKETGLIKIIRDDLPNKKRRVVQPTEECMKWISDAQYADELMTPHYLPTLIPPKKYNNKLKGGYHNKRIAIDLFKSNNELLSEISKGNEPYIQAAEIQANVAWRIKSWMLDAITHAYEQNLEVGCLIPINGWPIPPYPKHLEEDDPAVLKWRVRARSLHIKNEASKSHRIHNAILLNVARQMASKGEFFFPVQLDKRGRFYYRPPYLNPQGNDLARSLLEFGYYTYIQTEEQAHWLRIHGANLYGLKSDWRTRIDWVKEHDQLIKGAGNDPWVNPQFWMRADKPWSFLSFCRTYYEWSLDGPAYKCHQPVMLDCTASGIQHYSGFLRHEGMAEMVNCKNSDKPQDIYAVVMQKVNDRLRDEKDEHARKWLMLQPDRSLAKNPVMCIPYAASYSGFYSFAYKWGIKRAKDLYGNKNWMSKKGSASTIHYMAKILHEETSKTIEPAVQAMTWFKAVGSAAGKANTPLRWTTPSQLLVHQQYNKTQDRRIRLKYSSDICLDIRVKEDCPTLNTTKMSNGLSANIIHSMDSALMCATTINATAKNVINIGGIHDCFIATPSEMSALRDAVRESFVDIYKDDWLTRIKTELKAQIPKTKQEDLPSEPQLGNFDPTHTLSSNYFIT